MCDPEQDYSRAIVNGKQFEELAVAAGDISLVSDVQLDLIGQQSLDDSDGITFKTSYSEQARRAAIAQDVREQTQRNRAGKPIQLTNKRKIVTERRFD